jgi:WD40 repeat protein
MAFSPDGNSLAVYSVDSNYQGAGVDVFRVEDGTDLGYTDGAYTDLAFAADGQTLYLSDGEDIRGWRVGQDEMGPPLVFGARADTCGMAFSPASGLLATGSTDGGVFIWNLRDGTLAGVLRCPTDAVTDVEFPSDGTLLASGFIDGTVRLWGIR